MIRRDYILRMIEELIQVLSRISSLKRVQKWEEASSELTAELNRLVGSDSAALIELSETELLAKIIQGEPTLAVRNKTLGITTLLKEAGDIAGGLKKPEQARAAYLKGLHLLLHALSSGDPLDVPTFVPKLDEFLIALNETPLPLPTQGMLMQYYEQIGDLAKAEDALFAMLESEPDNPQLLDFGISFYQRLGTKADSSLVEGNLPREELNDSLKELCLRRSAL
jgi:hypothetical protein